MPVTKAPPAPAAKGGSSKTAGAHRLHGRLLDRLTKDTPKGEAWDALVMAALEGTAELDAQLETARTPAPGTTKAKAKPNKAGKAQATGEAPEAQPKLDLSPETKPATATLKSVTV